MFRRIAKDSAVLLAGETVSRLLLFATTVVLARALGPRAFGLVTFAQALLGYFLLLGDAGLSTFGVRAIAADSSQARAAWLGITRLRALVSSALVIAAWAALFALPLPRETRLVVGVTLSAALPAAFVADWACRGLGRMGLAVAIAVIQSAVGLILVLALVHGPAAVLWAPGARLLGAVAAALAGALALAGFPFLGGGGRQGAEWVRERGLGRLLAAGGVLLLTNLAVLAYNSADTVLLEPLAGERAVGLYGGAYRILQLPMAAFYTVTASVFPALVRLRTEDPRAGHAAMRRLAGLSFAAGLVLAVGLWAMRGPIVRVLYGPAYGESAAALGVLALALPIEFLVSIKGTGYIAAGLERTAAACAGAAALANIGANLALIPRFGMMGAAWTTLGTYLLLLALYVLVLDRKAHER